MWKSVLANITSGSKKVDDAFQALGIQLYQTGDNGQRSLKNVYDIILQLADAEKNATPDQAKYFEAISGGKYQYDTLRAAIANTKTIQDAYVTSLDSAGAAQKVASVQITTVQADLRRLGDTIQQIAFSGGVGGLTDAIKGLITGVTDLIIGLQHMNPWFLGLLALVPGLIIAFKGLRAVFNDFVSINKSITDSLRLFETRLIATQKAAVAEDASFKSVIRTLFGLGVAEEEATATTTGLATALDVLDAAIPFVGIGLAVGAIALGTYAVAAGNAEQQQSKLNQQIQQQNQVAGQALQQHGAEIQSLVNQYKQLDQTTAHGTVGNSDELSKYYDVSQKLGNYLPQLIQYVDQQGKSHLYTADAVQKQYEAQLKLNGLDKKSTISDSNSNFKSDLADYQSMVDKFNKDQKEIQQGFIQGGSAVTSTYFTQDSAEAKKLSADMSDLRQQEQATFADMSKNALNVAEAMSKITLSSRAQSYGAGLLSSVDFSKIKNAKQYQQVVENLKTAMVDITKAENDGSDSTNKLTQIFTAFGHGIPTITNNLNDMINSLTTATSAQQTSNQQIQSASDLVDSVITKNTNLDAALKELNTTHQVSHKTLALLLQDYPDLAQVTGLETDKIIQYIDAKKKENEATVQAEINQTEAVVNETKKRIQAIEAEMSALSAAEKMWMQESQQFASMGDMTNARRYAQLYNNEWGAQANQLSAYQSQLQAAINKLAVLKAGSYDITNVKGTVPKAAKAKKGSSSKTNPVDKAIDTRITEYEDTVNTLDQDLITRWQDVSKSYAQGSAQQISALQQVANAQQKYKNDLITEANYVKEEINNSSASAAEKAKLTKKYDQLVTSVEKANQSLADANYAVVTARIQSYSNALSDLSNRMSEVQNVMKLWNQETSQYKQAYQEQIDLINEEAQALANEQNYINSQMSNSGLTDAQKQQLQQTSQKTVQQYQSLQDQLLQIKKDAANQIVKAEQSAIQQQMTLLDQSHQQYLNQLNEEKTAYDNMINAQIQSLQRATQTQQYQEKLKTDQTNAQLLQNQIDALSMDKSAQGMQQKANLAKQLATLQQQISDQQYQRQNQLVQQNLQDQQKAYDKQIQDSQNAENTIYTNTKNKLQSMLSDSEYWNSQVDAIMSGSINDVASKLQSLTSTVNETFNLASTQTIQNASTINDQIMTLSEGIQNQMQIAGNSIQTNLVDSLNSAMQLLSQIGGVKSLGNIVGTASASGSSLNVGAGISVGGGTISSGGGSSSSGHSSGGSSSSGGHFNPSSMPLLEEWRGSRSQVEELQRTLNHFGYKLAVDGIFGPKTLAAVRSFQSKNHLSVDGIVGIHTWTALDRYDTGGYTGNLPSDGSLAVVHSKELILNQKDTTNILDAVKMIRDMGIGNIMNGASNFLSSLLDGITKSISVGNKGTDNGFGGTHINMPITIQNLNGGKEGANQLFSIVNSELKRKGLKLP